MVYQKYLDKIATELNDISPRSFIEPISPVAPEELILGTATDCQKQIYTLLRHAFYLAKDFQARAELLDNTNEQRNRDHAKASEYRCKEEFLRILFWNSIQDEFESWSFGNVGIRKGWHVVSSPEPPEPDANSIISDIIGRN